MAPNSAVNDYTDDECLAQLASQSLGRLAFHVGGRIEIFPVNYHAEGRRIVFRTAPGTKLAGAVIASDVAFQVDLVTGDAAWSVIAHGRARHLEHEADIEAAAELPLRPWIPTTKREFVEIEIATLSGREYRLAPEPLPEPETAA